MTDTAAKASKSEPSTGPRWSPNPWAIVAKTAFIARFPLGLLTAEELPKDAEGKPQWGGDGVIHLDSGPNILACLSPVFLYEDSPLTTAITAAPPESSLRAVHAQPGPGPGFLPEFTGERGALDVVRLEAGLLRALRWMADPANAKYGGNAYRFKPDRGHDTADLTLVRINDLLAAGGPDPAAMARLSHLAAKRQIPYSKNEAQLGALHDYAIRHGSMAAHVVEACRSRRKAFQRG